jgi:hypothetical protein
MEVEAAGSPWFRALAACLLAAAPTACSACPPEAAELAAHPDYRSPARTGASFFAALGCDDAAGEYRAFGERLKRRHGADLAAWLLARDEVRAELGAAVRYAHLLAPAREEPRADGVMVWWSAAGRERVGLLMERQNYLELLTEDGRELGFQLGAPPAAHLRMDGRRLLIEMAAENPVLRGLDPARVTRVTIGSEWKIADWELPDDQTPASLL